MTFIWGHYHKKIWRYQSIKQEDCTFKIESRSPRGQWVNWFCYQLIAKPANKTAAFAKLYSPTSANNSILAGVQYNLMHTVLPQHQPLTNWQWQKLMCRCSFTNTETAAFRWPDWYTRNVFYSAQGCSMQNFHSLCPEPMKWILDMTTRDNFYCISSAGPKPSQSCRLTGKLRAVAL